MYKLEYLPTAKEDMDNIIEYISSNLKNKTAAMKLSEKFIKSGKDILNFHLRILN